MAERKNQTRNAKVVNVKDYGAKGDWNGTTGADDTAAINAAIAACLALGSRWELYIPAGNYRVTAALTPITGGGFWRVRGDGRGVTKVVGTHNGPIFTIDVSLAHMYFTAFQDMAIGGEITGTFSSSVGILVQTDETQDFGLQYATFRSLQMRDIYRGIYIERTKKQIWNGVASVSWHTNFSFEDIMAPPPSGANEMHDCIYAEGPAPQISRINGGHLRGAASGGTGLTWGTGGTREACGDFLATNVHVVRAATSMVFKGPAGWASAADGYNENVTVIGCQFDNATDYTIDASNLKRCRFMLNNQTDSQDHRFTNCTQIARQDRDDFTFPGNVIAGGNKFVPYVLASSAVQIPDKGNVTSAQLFATIPIPGGAIGLNGRVEVTLMWSASGSSTKTVECRLANSPFRYRQITTGSPTRITMSGAFQNRNSQSAQFIGSNTIATDGVDTNTTTDLGVATASSADITIVGTKASGTPDQLALESYTIKVFPSA